MQYQVSQLQFCDWSEEQHIWLFARSASVDMFNAQNHSTDIDVIWHQRLHWDLLGRFPYTLYWSNIILTLCEVKITFIFSKEKLVVQIYGT